MQGHGNHSEDLISTLLERMEDPNDPTDYRLILEALSKSIMRTAKEVETTLMITKDAPQVNDNERTAQVIDKLHSRLDVVQDFLETTMPSQSESNLGSERNINNDLSTLRFWARCVTAIGILLILCFPVLVMFQLQRIQLEYCPVQDSDWMLQVGVLILMSFATGACAAVILLLGKI